MANLFVPGVSVCLCVCVRSMACLCEVCECEVCGWCVSVARLCVCVYVGSVAGVCVCVCVLANRFCHGVSVPMC